MNLVQQNNQAAVQSGHKIVRIKGTNLQLELSTNYIQNLNPILKAEISSESINKSSVETKLKLAKDICRLLNVRDSKNEMIDDWIMFIHLGKYELTPSEIFLAFQLAIQGVLRDSNGRAIELFPELSIITTGKVLASYMEFKRTNNGFLEAKKKMLLQIAPPITATEEQKKSIRRRYLISLLEEVKKSETGIAKDAWYIYDELIELKLINPSDIDKKILFAQEKVKFIYEERKSLHGKTNALDAFNESIQKGLYKFATTKNRCKSILVSNYIKRFVDTPEEFLKLLNY